MRALRSSRWASRALLSAGAVLSAAWLAGCTYAPAPVIDSGPANPTSATSATFTFHGTQPGLTFQCRVDGAAYVPCTSPVSYSGLASGPHSFDVEALDTKGDLPGSTDYAWTIGPGVPFQISGDVSALLYPGATALQIPLTLTNPNNFAITVTGVTVNLASTSASGCNQSWFSLTQSNISASRTVQVPPGGSLTLPGQGAQAPTVQMVESHTNQNACRNASLSFTYTGAAHS